MDKYQEMINACEHTSEKSDIFNLISTGTKDELLYDFKHSYMDMYNRCKEIYMETAEHFECNWTAVERNIRTAVSRAWSVNPDLLCQMAGYPLEYEPTSSQFIEIISSYIIRSHQPQPLVLP